MNYLKKIVNLFLNMLNVKYVIHDYNQNPGLNPNALGNAWFVSDFKFAKNADDEITLLSSINTKETAIISEKDEKYLNGYVSESDSGSLIDLVFYNPYIINNYFIYN